MFMTTLDPTGLAAVLDGLRVTASEREVALSVTLGSHDVLGECAIVQHRHGFEATLLSENCAMALLRTRTEPDVTTL